MDQPSIRKRARGPVLYAAGEIPLAEEAYIDLAPFRGGRSQSVDLNQPCFSRFSTSCSSTAFQAWNSRASCRVSDAEAQPRQFADLRPSPHDHAL